MFTLVSQQTGKESKVNFEQLERAVGEKLDPAFYSDIFVSHTIENSYGVWVITEGHYD